MTKNLMTRWINALKSGKYRRAKGRLRKDRYGKKTHCCLGVLRDLMASDKKTTYEALRYYAHRGMLSAAALNETGLTDELQKQLAAINDNQCTGPGYGKVIARLEVELPSCTR